MRSEALMKEGLKETLDRLDKAINILKHSLSQCKKIWGVFGNAKLLKKNK